MTDNAGAGKKQPSELYELFKFILQVGFIFLVIRSFLFQPFNIPSGSLVPTLLVGDYLFVSKTAYGYSRYSFPGSILPFEGRYFAEEPKRGDIAVFRLPKDDRVDYIKRVIGLPGDTVQMIEGRLYINGKIVERERIEDYQDDGIALPMYREVLPNGTNHLIIEKYDGHGPWNNTPLYTVPAGHYFMMGDNRDNSADSRDMNSVGFVPFENFVGRAEVLFFSIDKGQAWQIWRWPFAVRWNRLFTRIH